MDRFNLVVISAVLQVFLPNVLEQAPGSMSMYLKPDGWLINFDGYRPFPHDSLRMEVHFDLQEDLTVVHGIGAR